MFEKLKKAFLYSGVDEESYNRVIPEINRSNQMMVIVFSGLATVFISAVYVLSLFLQNVAQNQIVYLVGLVASSALFILSWAYCRKHAWLTVILVYISFSIFFLYGIFIGTITNPSQQTVTFMVMLVFMPVLFIDRPLRLSGAMLLYVVLFIILCLKNKTGEVLSTDIMDAIIFGFLGCTSGGIINHIKVRSYVLEKKLQDASRFDQLTKMNNRNSFEEDLAIIPDNCRKNLCCIYVDVNGLHELNNTKGHAMGDRMLQFVAEQMKNFFGPTYTYRIGGDEFVGFVIDSQEDKVETMLREMTACIEMEGYHIAVGQETMTKQELKMDVLITNAEEKMYRSKSRFYNEGSRTVRKNKDSVGNENK